MARLLRAGRRYLTEPGYRFLIHAQLGLHDAMPDEAYLRRKYRAVMGREPDLDNPRTFNEKLQWLKLYDRRPEYTMMADKVRVKDYVASKIGAEHIIPTLGVWEDPDDIDFAALPERFVLKCNHNSGLGLCICRDKSKLDIRKTKAELRKGLRQDFYLTSREWPYKDIPRRILAEKYMEDEKKGDASTYDAENVLINYKFFCFNSAPKCIQVETSNIVDGRKGSNSLLISMYDTNWNPAPFRRTDHMTIPTSVEKPACLAEMIEIAEKLSAGIPFVRVDLYEIQKKVYFSEFTFSPGAGFGGFSPEEWNTTLGDWLTLPEKPPVG